MELVAGKEVPADAVERWKLWPMVWDGKEWSVPDYVWHYVWHVLEEGGRSSRLFYLGIVDSADRFIQFMKNPINMPVLVMDMRTHEPVVLAWLTQYQEGVAESHFTFLKGLPRIDAGKLVMGYWNRLRNLRVLIGITPAHYTPAWKYALRMGYKKLGEIPGFCTMKFEGRCVPAVITYYQMEGRED